jgi:hypothetical protein
MGDERRGRARLAGGCDPGRAFHISTIGCTTLTKRQDQSRAAITHFLQRHDGLRSLSGRGTMAATSIVIVEHQHGVSKLPLPAGAQSFGSPQIGHTRFGFGNMTA